jgi:hypothetical protein
MMPRGHLEAEGSDSMRLMSLCWELPALLVAGWLWLALAKRRIPVSYFLVALGACGSSLLLMVVGALLDGFGLVMVGLLNALTGLCTVLILLLLTAIIELALHLLRPRRSRPSPGI